MDQDTPREPPARWIEALERGRADLAAGRTVSLATVLADLQAGLDRVEACQAEKAGNALKA